MTTTLNHGTYAMYEKNVRGFFATQFGLSVHPYADAKIIVDFLGGRPPYQCDRPEQRAYAAVSGCETGTYSPRFSPSRSRERRWPVPLAGSTGNGEC